MTNGSAQTMWIWKREHFFWIFENPTMDWTLILPFPKTGKYVSNKSASHIGRPPDFCFSDNILLQHLRISVYLKCAQLNLGCFSSGKLFRPFTNFGNRFSDLPLVFFNAIEQREKRGANIPRLMFMGGFTQTRGKGILAFVTNMELYLVASTLLATKISPGKHRECRVPVSSWIQTRSDWIHVVS